MTGVKWGWDWNGWLDKWTNGGVDGMRGGTIINYNYQSSTMIIQSTI
jgi:hypothetical protein